MFCGPVNNSTLQKYCRQQFGNERRMKRDTKTRWNSLKDMIQRFLDLEHCVQKALVDINKMELFPSKEEMHIWRDVCKALDIVEAGSKKICAQKCSLTKANYIFEFMFTQLENQGTSKYVIACPEINYRWTGDSWR